MARLRSTLREKTGKTEMIAQAHDTREVLGAFASKVENRSLLFEKYVLAKTWGHEARFHDANRFNVIRAASGGKQLLTEAANESEGKIKGLNTKEHVREEHQYRKMVAEELAQIREDDASLVALRVKSSLTSLRLLEKSYPGRHRTFVAGLGGRLLINLAGGVQENAGISLDRCFGMPLIPGSAIKGVSRHHALWEIRTCEDQQHRKQLLFSAMLIFGFGSQDLKLRENRNKESVTNWAWSVEDSPELLREAAKAIGTEDDFKGLVSFLPAAPASEKNLRIVAEGITPHTAQRDDLRKGIKAGDETQTLIPLAFPAVERGSQFAFGLVLNRSWAGGDEEESQRILSQALNWLQNAITGTGIGAKTSAGYGWFVVDEQAEEARRKEAENLAAEEARKAEERRLAEETKHAEEQRLASLSPMERFVEEIEKLDDNGFAEKAREVISGNLSEDETRAFFSVLTSSAKKERRKQWKKKKAAQFWNPLEEVASKLNIEIS